MAKKQVKRWIVRKVAKFGMPTGHWDQWYGLRAAMAGQRVAITHKGLEALERAVKKGSK